MTSDNLWLSKWIINFVKTQKVHTTLFPACYQAGKLGILFLPNILKWKLEFIPVAAWA
jgi:hypothetical protein